jgi:GWxTD domain-containing protein
MTSNIFSRVTGLLFALTAFVLPGSAQEMEQPRERGGETGQFRERSGVDIVSFEPHMFTDETGQVRVDILYRIRYDFFVFTRDAASTTPWYRAYGDVLIELTDSTETGVSRKVHSIGMKAANNENQQLRGEYYQGAASFIVHPGRFTAFYRVEDKESKREFVSKKEILRVLPFPNKSVVQSTVSFVEPVENPGLARSFTALNFNNATIFSKNTGAFITVSNTEVTPTVRYSLTQILPEGKERVVVQKDTTVAATLFPNSILALDPTSSNTVEYFLDTTKATASIYFPLATARLKQGRYIAQIHISAPETSTVSHEFSIRWNDMPLSLFDLDFAISAMRYIATDDEFEELQSGNRTKRIKTFEAFWEKRAPSSATAYNQVMAEYYRRVDYAFINFRTLKEDNGVLTDRGRIYILNGKPSNIERVFAPGGPPTEIWKYGSPKKRYIFEDPSRQGNYKLISTDTK